MNDHTAREILRATWQRRHGKAPSERALRVALAVACHESAGTYGAGPVSYRDINGDALVVTDRFNWGSAQCPPSEQTPCVEPNFRIADSRPPRAGETGSPKFSGNVPFWVCMKGFRTPEEGADYFLRTIDGSTPWQRKKTWAALQTGNAKAVAAAMYDEHYYSAWGKTREDRIDYYAGALSKRLQRFEETIGPLGSIESAEDPGVVVSGDVIKSYLRRVNAGYDALYQQSERAPYSEPPKEAEILFTRDYIAQLQRWKEFYEGAIDDWIPSGSDYSETRTFHEELIEYKKLFKKVFGITATGIPEIPTPSAAGDSLTKLAWVGLGVVALFGVGYAVRSVYVPAPKEKARR